MIVWQDGLRNPVAVRYNWADDAGQGNLFNQEGFPAAPFRSDNWQGLTDQIHYEVGK